MKPNLGLQTGDSQETIGRGEKQKVLSKEPSKLASSAPEGERSNRRLSFASSHNLLLYYCLASQAVNARGQPCNAAVPLYEGQSKL